MNQFQYHDNQLHAEDVPLLYIAERFGTPCYIYSRAALEASFLAYQTPLKAQDHLICYSVKANSNIAVLNILAKLGSGFDIVSGGELERVLAAGGEPDKVIFSGVGKTAAEMKRALEIGIHCFNVESRPELKRLNEEARKLNKVAPIALRVNPDVDAGTHPYISTGLKDNKFGVDINEAASLYQLAQAMPNISILGLDCHIGSQVMTLAPFLDSLDRLLLLIDELTELGIELKHLDIGGGLGVNYQGEQPPSQQDYISAIQTKLADRQLRLIIEPGRSICANAGVLLSKVEYIKCTEHKNFAIIDAAMNDLIRPALYQAWMSVMPALHHSEEHFQAHALPYDIVGPICESSDFMAKQRHLDIEPGSLLAICSAGAYGFTMSSNYNTRNRAAEVIVDGKSTHLVRQRESYAQQFQLESLLP